MRRCSKVVKYLTPPTYLTSNIGLQLEGGLENGIKSLHAILFLTAVNFNSTYAGNKKTCWVYKHWLG